MAPNMSDTNKPEITPQPPSEAKDMIFKPEIFEMILREVNFADVLRWQRVSRYHRDMIEQSPSLQWKIFRRPHPRAKANKPVINEALSKYLRWQLEHKQGNHFEGSMPDQPTEEDQGSWRGMFLTQPPIANMQIHVRKGNVGTVDTQGERAGEIVEEIWERANEVEQALTETPDLSEEESAIFSSWSLSASPQEGGMMELGEEGFESDVDVEEGKDDDDLYEDDVEDWELEGMDED